MMPYLSLVARVTSWTYMLTAVAGFIALETDYSIIRKIIACRWVHCKLSQRACVCARVCVCVCHHHFLFLWRVRFVADDMLWLGSVLLLATRLLADLQIAAFRCVFAAFVEASVLPTILLLCPYIQLYTPCIVINLNRFANGDSIASYLFLFTDNYQVAGHRGF